MASQSFLYGGDSGGGGGGGGGGGSALLTNKRVLSSSSKPLDSFFVSGSSPSFLGSRSMVSFEERGRPFFQTFDQEDNGDDEYDDYFHQPEKKRRLKADQVQFLEKSFETENKLEPERKIQLAKDLGLQPRQIAIWFQNRRARWKTKQLEKDYDDLQDGYNKLKSNYETLLKEKEKLKSQVRGLSDKLLMQEKAKGNSSSSSTKSQPEPPQQEQDLDGLHNTHTNPAHVVDDNVVVHDSDSPQGFQSPLLERVDSYVFEPDQSDGSMDEEENIMGKIFRPTAAGHMLAAAKFENPEYTDLQPAAADSCYFGYPGDDQSFGFWSYGVDSGP